MQFLALLTISNVFMNLAWYGHLKFKGSPLWLAIIASWGLAFLEYCFMVPANRIGSGVMSVTQMKIVQECITLAVFTVVAWLARRRPVDVSYAERDAPTCRAETV